MAGAVAAVAAVAVTRNAPIEAVKPGRKGAVASDGMAAVVGAVAGIVPRKQPAAKPVWPHAKSALRAPSGPSGRSGRSGMKHAARTGAKAEKADAADRVGVGASVRIAKPA